MQVNLVNYKAKLPYFLLNFILFFRLQNTDFEI